MALDQIYSREDISEGSGKSIFVMGGGRDNGPLKHVEVVVVLCLTAGGLIFPWERGRRGNPILVQNR